MKKRIVWILSGIVAILICGVIFAGIHYKKNAVLYALSTSDMQSSNITVDDQTYTFNYFGDWEAADLDQRIGYISGHQNDNLLLFYSFFEHGIYTLKEDPERNFLQIKRGFADKEYVLLVKDGYEFPSPDTVDFDFFTLFSNNDNKITDQELMRSIFDQYVNASDDQVFTYKQVRKSLNLFYQTEFYTSEYPSLCYYMTIYYSEADKAVYLEGEGNRYIRLTDDCAARFISCIK